MRVLFCTLNYPPGIAGGAEKQARLQAEELVLRGHRVEVVCPRWDRLQTGRVNGVVVHRLPFLRALPWQLTYPWLLLAFILARGATFDIVHVHLGNIQADAAGVAALLTGTPTYVKLAAGGPRGEVGRMRQLAWVTHFFGIRHAAAVQALNGEIEQELTHLGVSRDRIHRIPNGVRCTVEAASASARLAAREALGLDPDTFVALYMGRLEREKGVADLLQAWRSAHRPNQVLLLVGSPGLRDAVDVANAASVRYDPWTDETDRYLAAADCFILPSRVEGMSNALLEAMAAGLSVITTDVGAARTLVRDNENGVVVAPGDVKSLAGAIALYGDRPELRKQFGGAARETVCPGLSIERVVSQVVDVYQSVVKIHG